MDALLSHETMGKDLRMEVYLTNMFKNTDCECEIAFIQQFNKQEINKLRWWKGCGHHSIMLTSIKLLLAIVKILVSV